MDLQLEHTLFVNIEGGNIMRKFEYVDEAKKVCIIVLKDHFGNTISKGIARCSEDDTFNKDAGLKLANARAWKKYFDSAREKEISQNVSPAKFKEIFGKENVYIELYARD